MAEFYSARGWEIPPLPWTNLSPPFSPVCVHGLLEAPGIARAFPQRLESVAEAVLCHRPINGHTLAGADPQGRAVGFHGLLDTLRAVFPLSLVQVEKNAAKVALRRGPVERHAFRRKHLKRVAVGRFGLLQARRAALPPGQGRKSGA